MILISSCQLVPTERFGCSPPSWSSRCSSSSSWCQRLAANRWKKSRSFIPEKFRPTKKNFRPLSNKPEPADIASQVWPTWSWRRHRFSKKTFFKNFGSKMKQKQYVFYSFFTHYRGVVSQQLIGKLRCSLKCLTVLNMIVQKTVVLGD